MFIRNGQAANSKISDISELTPNIKNKTKKRKKEKSSIKTTENKISRFTEYLSGRKYYILFFSIVYIIGLLIGAILIKNLSAKDTSDLCSLIDDYFTGIPSINMTARIFGSIALNMAFLFGIYISGVTVFAPFICSAFCLYKGLSGGFMMGVYIIGGSTLFHLGVCGINFILELFEMLFFILACAESMSFSRFLFRSEDNFKNNLSFKNVSTYSSRHLLFLILLSMTAIVQTIVIPVIYTVWG